MWRLLFWFWSEKENSSQPLVWLGAVGPHRARCRHYPVLLIGLSEPGLELGPLLTSELNLAAEIIREDDLFRVREVDRVATALHTAQSDHSNFESTLRYHDNTPIL